jgi:uncharacterized protein (TIRG00374 family)
MKIIKQLIQYILPLAIAALLLGYVYQDFDWGAFLSQLQTVKLGWILVSVGLTLVSYAIRAYRWKLLLESLGFRLSLLKAFIALMIGYVSNLLIPRLGELVRCTVLKRHTDIPTSTSLGTVVAERAIDLVSLLAVLGVTLVIAFDQLKSVFYDTLLASINPGAIKMVGWGSGIVIVVVILLVLVIRRRRVAQEPTWLSKIQQVFQGIWQGIKSISLLDTKNTTLVLTLLMWLLYYLAGYVGVLAITETSSLSWSAGLAILAMSSISLSLPIQGGIGAYHLLVSSTLMAYGISKDSAMLYVTLMHTSQLLMTLLAGGTSMIVGLFLIRPSAKVC